MDITKLWELRGQLRLINKQQPDGSRRYLVKKPASVNYDIYENLGVNHLACDTHPGIRVPHR